MVDIVPTKNASEMIETLARKLERSRIKNDLMECNTLEDLQKLKEKYELLCEEDNKTM